MLASETIRQIEELILLHGDCELDVYLSYSKVNRAEPEVYYDDELNKISLGVYG